MNISRKKVNHFDPYKRKLIIGGIILLCISFILSNILVVYNLGSEFIIIVLTVILCGVAGLGLTMYDILKNKQSLI
jgi:hypothetical protein